MIALEFFVKRKSKQTIATIIVPLTVIGILAVLGALIDYNCGEKYGHDDQNFNDFHNQSVYIIINQLKSIHRGSRYLITVFLALIFYLQLMEAKISPAGDKDLPLILWVLFANATCLTYSLFETIFLGTFDRSKPLPLPFRKLVEMCDGCCKRTKITPTEQTDLTPYDKDKVLYTGSTEKFVDINYIRCNFITILLYN